MKSPAVVSLVAGAVIGLGMLGNSQANRLPQQPIVIAKIEQRDHSIMPEQLMRSIISEVSDYSLDDGTDLTEDTAEHEQESTPGKSAEPRTSGVGLSNSEERKSRVNTGH